MSGENDTSVALLIVSILGIVIVLASTIRDRMQQRTIDRLTDKLMARSYVEYKSMESVKEEDASPAPQREEEARGWYDH